MKEERRWKRRGFKTSISWNSIMVYGLESIANQVNLNGKLIRLSKLRKLSMIWLSTSNSYAKQVDCELLGQVVFLQVFKACFLPPQVSHKICFY